VSVGDGRWDVKLLRTVKGIEKLRSCQKFGERRMAEIGRARTISLVRNLREANQISSANARTQMPDFWSNRSNFACASLGVVTSCHRQTET
jgi:hypothetical protein